MKRARERCSQNWLNDLLTLILNRCFALSSGSEDRVFLWNTCRFLPRKFFCTPQPQWPVRSWYQPLTLVVLAKCGLRRLGVFAVSDGNRPFYGWIVWANDILYLTRCYIATFLLMCSWLFQFRILFHFRHQLIHRGEHVFMRIWYLVWVRVKFFSRICFIELWQRIET